MVIRLRRRLAHMSLEELIEIYNNAPEDPYSWSKPDKLRKKRRKNYN